MMRATLFLSLAVLLLAGGLSGFGQTFDARLVVMLNDGVNFDVKVQIKANVSTFALGTSNFIFSFDGTALSAPTLQTAHNFSGNNYQTMVLGGSGKSRSISIELKDPGTGTTVTTSYLDVATIRFTVTNPAGGSNLQWNGVATVVYKDDEATVVSPGTLNDFNTTPLPGQLASFSARMGQQGGQVLLKWSTVSEVNNYGFTVQRKGENGPDFVDRNDAFLAGKGTTIEPQSYSYVDKSIVKAGSYSYRLKRQDLDGTIHYTQSVIVNVTVTDVAEVAPRMFQLLQNYPNPFNPATQVKFSVETTGKAVVKVYNTLGEEVATLFEGTAEAGRYYVATFNSTGLASGIYLYRLITQRKTDVRKMLMLR